MPCWPWRQNRREQRDAPREYFKGLNLLLNEQYDKAIDVFVEAVQHDPGASDLHFALGNLFRRRGDYERAVRVHEHLLARPDLPRTERERAQHALAQDFIRAGLFDRAEQACVALEGTAFATDAQLALLTLYERSRQWRQAISTARRLEHSGLGSFSIRTSHHWCEIATESDARGDTAQAVHALEEARRAAPQAPRPLAALGARAAASGDAPGALGAWGELLALHPHAFALVAVAYARQAIAADQRAPAFTRLLEAYNRDPGLDLLNALDVLDEDPDRRRARTAEHLRQHPSLGASLRLLRASPGKAPAADEATAITEAVAAAARPLQRYRCAACGFEAQQHFWQCPGCLGWDTLPPRRLEES